MHTMTYSINYWSKGEIQALFLRHEGYLCAIGAFLAGMEQTDAKGYAWGENLAGSSGLQVIWGRERMDKKIKCLHTYLGFEMDCTKVLQLHVRLERPGLPHRF